MCTEVGWLHGCGAKIRKWTKKMNHPVYIIGRLVLDVSGQPVAILPRSHEQNKDQTSIEMTGDKHFNMTTGQKKEHMEDCQ